MGGQALITMVNGSDSTNLNEGLRMPGEKYREVPIDSLHLDPDNPRLPMGIDWSSETEGRFLREFYRRYNLIELARSVVDKGFTPRHAEALLVVKDSPDTGLESPLDPKQDDSVSAESENPPDPESYVVVEGNRRLATLKLLTSEANRKAAEIRGKEWEELANKASSLNLQLVPVIVYPSRDELNAYLGFRHITGPSPWRPEAKARFIAKLLEEGQPVGDVARQIGSNHRTVRRYAEAHAIYVQGMKADIPVDEVEAGFGVFYNALDWEGVRDYLKLGRQAEINQLPVSPIPPDRVDGIRDLIGLLYGDSSRNLERVIRESRDLSKLSQVLGSERARANLFRDRDLERAWRVSGGGRIELLGLLADLHSRLAEVNGQAREYSEDAEVQDEVRRIRNLVFDMAERYKVGDC